MILLLKPYFSQKPWAGNELNKIYDCPEQTGEAWIVSGFLKKSAYISNGPLKGKSLRYVWNNYPQLFANFGGKEFPILIKLISAKENLSIQVHPNDDYALKNYNSFGKFECWYIMPENKAKSVMLGTSLNDSAFLKQVLQTGTLENYINKKPIKTGDLVIVPPGTIHALESGSFVLEIQESSDLTYRLYDFMKNRNRKLHIDEALKVVNYQLNKNLVYELNLGEEYDDTHFSVSKIKVQDTYNFNNTNFAIAYVLNGSGIVSDTNVKKGDAFILCHDVVSYVFQGDLELILVVPKQAKKEMSNLRKKALISGIVSQDGLYLLDLLLDKGYEVHGIVQSYSQLASASLKKYINNEQIINKYLFFHVGDITDTSSVSKIIEDIRPDEMYHLASQTHVDLSFEIPEYTAQVNALGTLRILEAIKRSETRIKLFNLSTCQLFSGDIYPQNEETVFDPKSPYAISKLYAHYMIKSYRENYNLFAVNGICYNHDSPRKEDYFLSRKVCEHLKNNPYKVLKLGNLNPIREWGHAKDYAEAMWLMLQQDTPNDFIVATGEALSVRDFVTLAYKMAGITLNWQGEGLDEIATDAKTGQKLIEVDSNLIRPNDAKCLVGDATKIKKMIGWQPKHSVKDLIVEMLED